MKTRVMAMVALAGLGMTAAPLAAQLDTPLRGRHASRPVPARPTATVSQGGTVAKPLAPVVRSVAPDRLPTVDADGPSGQSGDPTVVSFWLTVLHTNDHESKLLPISGSTAGAASNPNGFAGAALMKAHIDRLRTQVSTVPADAGSPARGSVLVTSGDNILPGVNLNASLALPMGSPFYDTLFFQAAGYDTIALGNHDFDLGPAVLGRFISSFPSPIPFLSSNLDFSNDPSLSGLPATRLAKSAVISTPGGDVGIVGATTEALPFISQPGAVLVNPVLMAVQAQVNQLTGSGVKHIILTTHLQGLASEFNLVPLLQNVDAVVGGGGSELLANPSDLLVPGDSRFTTNLGGTGYPRFALDSQGKSVPLVTTAGDFKYVGRLILGFNHLGEVIAIDSASGPVRVSPASRVVAGVPQNFADGHAPDAIVRNTVELPVEAYRAVLASTFIAGSTVGLDGRSATPIRTAESNLGNLLADSLLWHGTVYGATFGTPIPTIAITNGGGIRNNSIVGPGPISVLNTFDIAPFNNTAVVVPNVSPARLKQLLENCVANVPGTPGGGSDTGRFGQISGFTFTWNAQGVRQLTTTSNLDAYTRTNTITQQGSRIVDVTLNDGTAIIRNGAVVPGAPSVNIATVDFLAQGGDQYKLEDLVNIRLGAFTYQLVLENYIRQWLAGDINGMNYPTTGEGRIIRRN